MAEYIEREAAIEKTEAFCDVFVTKWTDEKVLAWIRNLPAADVMEVRHGRWVGLEYDGFADGCPVYDLWECSECGEEVSGEDVPDTHPYCPNCGCRMDKDGE